MGEVVLAYPRDLINEVLPEGFSTELTRSVLAEKVRGAAIWGDRAELKAAATDKQVIDYGIYIIEGEDDQADLISLYQRAKTVGEEKLMGNFSIGYGGHADKATDAHYYADGNTHLVNVLHASRQREESEEISIKSAAGEALSQVPYFHLGWLNDNANAIGQIHFAAVSLAVLPAGSVITSNEPNQVIQGAFTLAELAEKKEESAFENWSDLLLPVLAPLFNAAGKLAIRIEYSPTGDSSVVADTEVAA